MVLPGTCRAAVAADGPLSVADYLGLTVFKEVRVSPDGLRIAVVTTRDDFQTNRTEETLTRIALDPEGRFAGSHRIAAGEGNFFDLRWSPDGRWLTWLATRVPGTVPLLFGLQEGKREPIALTERKHHRLGIGTYDWLPDGSAVLISAPLTRDPEAETAWREHYGDVMRFPPRPPRTGLFHLPVAGFGRRRAEPIGEVAHTVIELAAAPSGDRIAFTTLPATEPRLFFNGFADSEIYLLDWRGGEGGEGPGEPRRLTDNHVIEGTLRWSSGGDALYAAGSGEPGADRTRWTQGRLFRIDAADGSVRRIAPGFEGDFNALVGETPFAVLPGDRLLAVANVSTSIHLYQVDPGSGETRQLTRFAGQVASLSASSDGGRIAFVLATEDRYPELYLARGLDRIDRPDRLTGWNEARNGPGWPATETVRWENGEGDTIEGVLFRPPGKQAAGRLPLVVELHGGPWQARLQTAAANSEWNFNRSSPLLASRGYLVLEPNYRGSSGRGDRFLHALEGHSCTRPARDILSGVDALVERGLADPGRVAVIGYSYGGLLVNCLIGRTDRFRAAVSGAGIWNDLSYFGTADNWVQTDVRYEGRAPWEDFERYWRESAISAAGNIRTPTLILIGGADTRIPTSQGYEMYRALEWLEVPSELLIFPGENHRFRRPSHKRILVQAGIDWIERHLSGKP